MTKELKKVVVIETPEKQLHLKMVMRNLDRVIEKAKPNMDKIKDVDEFLDGLNNINLLNKNKMASWKKFKNRITEKEIKVRPIHNQKDLGLRKQIGVGLDIDGNEVILNDLQIKELICYLVKIS